MTREEHRAVNEAAFPRLKPVIDAGYPPKQFVAIANGEIVADDADFDKLVAKLAVLGIGRMDALFERAGDPVPGRAVFPGMMKLTAISRAIWNFETRTGA
jgi:hypothetical protein